MVLMAKLWNSLSLKLRMAQSVHGFKKKLKTWLFDQFQALIIWYVLSPWFERQGASAEVAERYTNAFD